LACLRIIAEVAKKVAARGTVQAKFVALERNALAVAWSGAGHFERAFVRDTDKGEATMA
jgi:hypothetical protein